MREELKQLLMKLQLDNAARKVTRLVSTSGSSILKFPPYDDSATSLIRSSIDPVRYAAVALAINTILKEQIPGSFAEVGVYRGELSKLVHRLAPHVPIYLFDTFAGFPSQDLERVDQRFKDTSLEVVKRTLDDLNNVYFRPGYFPETASGLEAERFSFVILDLDLYKPTLAGLEWFYPRMNPGGFVFAHDYNSPESQRAVSRAVNEYMKDKPEKLVELPDKWGSVVFRKN